MRRYFLLATILFLLIACGLPAVSTPAVPAEPPATDIAAATDAPAAQPTSAPAGGGAPAGSLPQGTPLDPCTLLLPEEAAQALGEAVLPKGVSGGACIYGAEANPAHVISAYAFQGEQTRKTFAGRFFLLSAFGLQADPASIDLLNSLDAQGDQPAVLLKVSELGAGNPNFSSRSLEGLGDVAYWAWKDLGNGVSQGFLIVAQEGLVAGTDMVHGSNLDETAALEQARQVVLRLLERLPEKFTIAIATPAAPLSPTFTPTAPPDLPTFTPTPVAADLPGPTPQGGGGGLIAFESDRSGGSNIWLMKADGSELRQLTWQGGSTPAWSPDGSQVAYLRFYQQDVWLYVINADGSGERGVVLTGVIAGRPTWSPDGERLAFTSDLDGNYEVYLVNLDGSGLVNLSNHPGGDWEPAWSPDGSQIALVSQRSGANEIWSLNVDGSGAAQLTALGGAAGNPAWSPEGSRLAFEHTPSGSAFSQIFIMDLNGGGPSNQINAKFDSRAPVWSADGAYIVFHGAEYRGNWDICLLSLGSGWINLTNQPSSDSFPSWQP